MPATGIELTLQTLLRSTNPVATELLLIALESSDGALRVGAVRALAMRDDVAGHRGLVERFPRLSADARAAIVDVPSRAPLATALSAMIRPKTPKLARRAAELAVLWGATPTLAAIVEAAQWPASDLADAFSKAALSLARRLEERIREHDPTQRTEGEDPAFARRAAVNALAVALDRFDTHRSVDLLEALLLLTPSDEPALLRALRHEEHVAHDALLARLKGSTSHGALRVLAQVLADITATQRLIDIAADRSDPAGLALLLGFVGYPVGLRLRENCQRIEAFAWLDPERKKRLLDLPALAQATAVTIAAASNASRQQVAELILLLLDADQPGAALAACRAIDSLPSRLAAEPLQLALANADAGVVAAAAAMLRRKKCPGAFQVLVDLLDHSDNRVRTAAQRSLRELSYASFRDSRHEMSLEAQRRVGQLVGKADPLVVPSLKAELNAAAVSRRLAALDLVDVMGAAEGLAEVLSERVLCDTDVGVRVEVASLLGRVSPLPSVLGALQEAAEDRSPAVRSAAVKSLQRLGTGPVLAAGLA